MNAKASGGEKKVESVLPDDLVRIDFEKQRSSYNRRAARFVQGPYAQAKCMTSVILLKHVAGLHFHFSSMAVSEQPEGSTRPFMLSLI